MAGDARATGNMLIGGNVGIGTTSPMWIALTIVDPWNDRRIEEHGRLVLDLS